VSAEHWSAAPFVPESRSLATLARAAQSCTGCPLYIDTTQTVFGSGRRDADIILVGEQPGDQEDRKGEPFVGPAGAVLWRCVEKAGVEPNRLYVTNAVKHFKHEARGKRRLHKKPTTLEAEACHPWLAAELGAVRAKVVVALGAVAARALMGKPVAVSRSADEVFEVDGRQVLVTYHPSAALRAEEQAVAIRARIVADLRRAEQLADSG
jgi:uracil-DNA glycosylase